MARPGKPVSDWGDAFIAELSESGNLRKACIAANVSRAHAFRAKAENPLFAERWEETMKQNVDEIEANTIEHAMRGVKKPLHHKGELTGDEVIEWDHRLMIDVLRAKRPDVWAKPDDNKNSRDEIARFMVEFMAATQDRTQVEVEDDSNDES